jgi:chemotaxis protein MotB
MNRRASRGRVSHDRWLVSYADFITLMFAFFVVLYATATANQKKQAQVSESIDSAFHSLGIFPGSARISSDAPVSPGPAQPAAVPAADVSDQDVVAAAAVRADLHRIQGQLAQTLASQVASRTVSIQMGRDGLVISLREAGFFDSGSAEPKPGTLPVLRTIAASIARTPYDLRVEGHTDNVPIHTSQFASNWELSTARATELAKSFIVDHGISPARLSAAGYAEYHPVASNDTAEGRGQNRRVDIIVLPRISVAPQKPAAGH